MKTLAFLLLLLPGLALSQARAQDTAIFDFRIDHEKMPRRVVIALDASAAPVTVANFEKLIRHKFYKDLKVHRIIPGTLVQTGDPNSRWSDRASVGTGGPGYTLPPEIHLTHTAGAVAMSRLPDPINPARRSSGSQFYICLKPMPSLDGQYTVFGHVVAGMDNLQAISTVPADTNNNPTSPVVITGAYLDTAPAPRKYGFRIWPWGS